jgi:hypothetical protein
MLFQQLSIILLAYLVIGYQTIQFYSHICEVSEIETPQGHFVLWGLFWPLAFRGEIHETLWVGNGRFGDASLKEPKYLSNVRARSLFFSVLSKKEAAEFSKSSEVLVKNEYGSFLVGRGSFVYRIPDGWIEVKGKYKSANILNCDAFCIQFEDYKMPNFDALLMKVALLKVDPGKFLSIANIKTRDGWKPNTAYLRVS